MANFELIRFSDRPAAPAVAAVGFFDGVHRGHQFLLGEVKAVAARRDCAALAVTFGEHPRRVLRSGYRPELLSTPAEKVALLGAAGLDAVAVLRFTPELAALTSRQFLGQVLREQLGVEVLLVGYDHHFGSDTASTLADYQAEGRALGVEVVGAEAFATGALTVSSSAVRRLLEAGDVAQAAQALGRPYALTGTVVEGCHVGHELGFPTANVRPSHPDKLVPGRGAYAVEVEVDGCRHAAMLNVGFRPTLDDTRGLTIEAHLLDFDGDLYGRRLTLRFLQRLRSEQRFASLDELRAQLEADAAQTRALFQL